MATEPKSPNSRVGVSFPAMDLDASIWDDWSDLLDFTLDDADPFILTSDPPPPPPPQAQLDPPAAAAAGSAGKVRKRDPRLVCENFLAGRVPCACPEVDEMMLREEEDAAAAGEGGRKRVRVRSAAEAPVVRCQVAGCEADIRELKGYHRRHRVCLRCANASSVVIDGEEKRYCQQCGKFHILPDFDEGKRSCRRKLERHNRRRRRRPIDDVSVAEKETGSPKDLSTEATYGGETKEENGFSCEAVLSSKSNDRDILLESDGHGSPIPSLPTQNMQSNSDVPFAVPGEAHIDNEKDYSKSVLSSTICDNRSAYSSLCPTGRISFKLYDWNPAEFPRLLRHQIFQWLASMPVELEGYVRPGCTILTIFIAMPQFMWEKLSQDATIYIKDLVNAPDSLFSGRGNIFIFLSNMIIQRCAPLFLDILAALDWCNIFLTPALSVLGPFSVYQRGYSSFKVSDTYFPSLNLDGSSLMNIKMEVKAPRIHYVHPTYFEAGKPMEFVACGSNLNQAKFRFLVSFAGKYMIYESYAISHGKVMPCDGTKENSCQDFEHEMFRIRVSQTDPKIFGPGFIEVENESGISNFIPILVGNKYMCSDLQKMQVALSGSLADSLTSQITISGANPSLCGLLAAKQTAFSELLVDIAWLLKEPCIDESRAIFNSVNLQRLTCLLKISIENELVSILEVILQHLDVMIGSVEIQDSECLIPDVDPKQLQENVQRAKEILNQRGLQDVTAELVMESSRQKDIMPQSYVTNTKNQDGDTRSRNCMCSSLASSSSRENDENVPLIGSDRKHCYPNLHVDWPQNPWAHSLTGTRLALFVTVSVVMCIGACIVLLHPLKPGEIAVSIRRCLFGYRFP